MRSLPAVAASTLALLLAGGTLRADEVRTLAESVPIDGVRSLEIDLPVGELLLEGSERSDVGVTMSVRCERERCRERTENIELVSERKGDLLKVKVKGLTRGTATGIEVKLLVEAPGNLPTEVDLLAGEVRVRGMTADLEIDLGVGDVEVEMARAVVKRVDLDAGVGNATLRTDLGEIVGSGVVGSSLEWSQADGTTSIQIDTGVGEIAVELR